jgi:hypothetical protein
VEFTIEINSSLSVCWIDVRPPGGSWQKLYISNDDGGPIHTGDQRTFTLRAGYYSFRIMDCDNVVLPFLHFHILPDMGIISI